MGGFLGTLLIGVLADSTINGIQAGFRQFFVQLFGAVIIGIYSIIVTYIIFVVVDKIKTIKVSEEIQREGLDKVFFGESVIDLQED